jgi:hypothetical protein
MEIICRRFAINPTQRRSYSSRRAVNKIIGKAGLLTLAEPTLSRTILCNY